MAKSFTRIPAPALEQTSNWIWQDDQGFHYITSDEQPPRSVSHALRIAEFGSMIIHTNRASIPVIDTRDGRATRVSLSHEAAFALQQLLPSLMQFQGVEVAALSKLLFLAAQRAILEVPDADTSEGKIRRRDAL